MLFDGVQRTPQTRWSGLLNKYRYKRTTQHLEVELDA